MAPLEEKCLLPEHAQAAAAYQENTGQDDEKTTASARGPGAVGPARTIVPVEILGTHSTRETWIYHWTPPSPKVQSPRKLSGRVTFFEANTMPASIVQFRGRQQFHGQRKVPKNIGQYWMSLRCDGSGGLFPLGTKTRFGFPKLGPAFHACWLGLNKPSGILRQVTALHRFQCID